MSGPELSVSISAIAANARLLRGEQRLIAVVKADGFGMGQSTVAEAALTGGASMLGAATLTEGLSLVEHGVPVLCWLSEPDELRTALPDALEIALPTRAHLAALSAAPGSGPRRVHLFVDTGMSRDGCPATEWTALCRAARAADVTGAIRVVGVMGHLGCTDPVELDHQLANRRFRRALATAHRVGLRPEQVHLAATQACLNAEGTRHDTVRVGAGLVGIDPVARLNPVARLQAPIIQVRRALPGNLVGYGTGTRVDRPGYLGLVPLGYADGLPRAASGHASVLVAGERRRLLGTFSMDQVVVDLGDRPVPVGTPVTIFGPGPDGEPTVSDWAEWAGTIEHEVLTGIGSRVPRRAVQAFDLARCAA